MESRPRCVRASTGNSRATFSTTASSSRCSTKWTTESPAAGVRGLALRSSPPFVNYPEIGKSRRRRPPRLHDWGGGVIHVPIGGVVNDFDPAHDGDPRAGRDDAARLRDADTGPRRRPRRPVARLGSDPRGRRRALPLPAPAGVRFHDGRAVSARDVRYSFERLLQTANERRPVPPRPDPGRPEPHRRKSLGSRGLPHRQPFGVRHRAREAAVVLPGPRVVPGAAIVPEGTGTIGDSWRKGCIGTGRTVSWPSSPPKGSSSSGTRLLARRLPQERRRRLPVRRAPRGDPQRVPRGPVLGRVGSPSGRR